MTCNCFNPDKPTKLRKSKKTPSVFHWPNFTWTHSEDNLRYRHHHHSRFFFFRHPLLHRNRSTEEQIVAWERYKASQSRQDRPALSRHNTVDQAHLEYLGSRQPHVHFDTELAFSQDLNRELFLFPAACITPIHSDELTSLDRNSHHLIWTRLPLLRVLHRRTNQQRPTHLHRHQDPLLRISKSSVLTRATNLHHHQDRLHHGRVGRMTRL